MNGLLMTRPRAAAEKFVAGLPGWVTSAFPAVYAPLMKIAPLNVVPEVAPYRGLIFTSANGAAQAGRLIADRSLPVWCVGPATTRAAQNLGWQAEMRGENAAELIASLLQDPPAAPLLHLRGRHVTGDIAGTLSEAGLPCQDLAIYDQQLQHLIPEAIDLLTGSGDVIVPLFSPRSARQFADSCPDHARPHLIVISQAVADEVKELNLNSLHICRSPNSEAVAAEIVKLCTALHRVEGDGPAQ
jgi:uroporphyrinogen-III synthase